MRKIIFSFFSIFIGLALFVMWEVGSHGPTLEFHSNRIEDWILVSVIIISLGLPIYFTVTWIVRKIR